MDDGTDARDVLENRLLPLRRGRNLHATLAVYLLLLSLVLLLYLLYE